MIPQGRSGKEVEMWRERILDVAEEHFRRIGYQKTSVADVASCLRMSSTNVYRFFPSRAAINESICDRFVEQTIHLAAAVARQDAPAHDRLRRLFNLLYEERRRQFIEEKHVHDLIVAATTENWPIMSAHCSRLLTIVREIIEEGIEAGDYCVNDPDEAARSAMNAFSSFYHPVLVEARLREPEVARQGLDQQINFILSALGG
nr:TetR/AcrR family transcriptional regulator [Neorhizobium galegae]